MFRNVLALFGEGYWENSGSYDDVRYRLSDWSRAGEIPAKGVWVWTPRLQWVSAVCVPRMTGCWEERGVGVGEGVVEGIPNVTTLQHIQRRPTYWLWYNRGLDITTRAVSWSWTSAGAEWLEVDGCDLVHSEWIRFSKLTWTFELVIMFLQSSC